MAEGQILKRDEYPSIRRVIDVTMTPEELPQDVIEDLMYLPLAEAEVIRYVPTAPSLTGPDLQQAKMAVVWLTAALLLPAIPRIVAESFGDMQRYERDLLDTVTQQDEWRAKAMASLREISAPTELPQETAFPWFEIVSVGGIVP